MDIEIWKTVPVDDRYLVSNLGRIKRISSQRIMKLNTHKKTGYIYISFYRDHKTRTFAVHRIVTQAFHGDPPTPQHEPNHIDFDRTNNRADNLEWKTRKENLHHSKLQGRDNSGSRNGGAKLSEQDVVTIRHLLAEGIKGITLSKQFNVSKAQISRIKTGVKWTHSLTP